MWWFRDQDAGGVTQTIELKWVNIGILFLAFLFPFLLQLIWLIFNIVVESKSTEDLDVINPATEEVIDTVTLANEDDAEKAIKGANVAQLEWEKVNIIKRAKIVCVLAVWGT